MSERQAELARILEELECSIFDYDLQDVVPALELPPPPLQFLREFAARNRPVLVRNSINHWPALQKWSLAHLASALQETEVDVTLTPQGRADSVVRNAAGVEVFALPHTERMTMAKFQQMFSHTKQCSEQPCVPSVQFQNSNLTTQFRELEADIELDVAWATEAFGCKPEAVNLWIGDHRYSTSFHKDLYENMYAVVTGSKTFTLLPPCSVHRMHLHSYPVFQYVSLPDGTFRLDEQQPPSRLQWCPIDLDAAAEQSDQHAARYPRYCAGPPPLVVTVHAGEVLYLPANWYHYVQQDELAADSVIAVNFWYDRPVDASAACCAALEKLAVCAGLAEL